MFIYWREKTRPKYRNLNSENINCIMFYFLYWLYRFSSVDSPLDFRFVLERLLNIEVLS